MSHQPMLRPFVALLVLVSAATACDRSHVVAGPPPGSTPPATTAPAFDARAPRGAPARSGAIDRDTGGDPPLDRSGSSPPAPSSAATTALHAPTADERRRYAWLTGDERIRALEDAFAPPPGFSRIPRGADSFGAWLRRLPLRPAGAPVLSYRGQVRAEGDSPSIGAVAELDVGKADLQQCADSVLRLHAEWLWSSGRAGAIGYRVTSGDLASWPRWASGERATVADDHLRWGPAARPDDSHRSLRAFLDLVFTYAGSVSLARYSSPAARAEVEPGDFFVLPGGPGHAVVVLDMARDARGRTRALLGQGYMPAQDFHVLAMGGEAWFDLDVEAVETPFWPVPFPWSSLRRLPAGT